MKQERKCPTFHRIILSNNPPPTQTVPSGEIYTCDEEGDNLLRFVRRRLGNKTKREFLQNVVRQLYHELTSGQTVWAL